MSYRFELVTLDLQWILTCYNRLKIQFELVTIEKILTNDNLEFRIHFKALGFFLVVVLRLTGVLPCLLWASSPHNWPRPFIGVYAADHGCNYTSFQSLIVIHSFRSTGCVGVRGGFEFAVLCPPLDW